MGNPAQSTTIYWDGTLHVSTEWLQFNRRSYRIDDISEARLQSTRALRDPAWALLSLLFLFVAFILACSVFFLLHLNSDWLGQLFIGSLAGVFWFLFYAALYRPNLRTSQDLDAVVVRVRKKEVISFISLDEQQAGRVLEAIKIARNGQMIEPWRPDTAGEDDETGNFLYRDYNFAVTTDQVYVLGRPYPLDAAQSVRMSRLCTTSAYWLPLISGGPALLTIPISSVFFKWLDPLIISLRSEYVSLAMLLFFALFIVVFGLIYYGGLRLFFRTRRYELYLNSIPAVMLSGPTGKEVVFASLDYNYVWRVTQVLWAATKDRMLHSALSER